jgi:hypothetical protein
MSPAMLDDKRWVYEVPYVNKNGERHIVVVNLTDSERRHLLEYEAFHPGHTGGDDGLIANAFALRHADKKAPAGFVPAIEEIKRVSALRLVN